VANLAETIMVHTYDSNCLSDMLLVCIRMRLH